MKILNLLMWVGQFGFSVIFPTLFFLLLASWLQRQLGVGSWVTVVLGILGIMTSWTTAKSCFKSMMKAAEELSPPKEPPVSFNDHS